MEVLWRLGYLLAFLTIGLGGRQVGLLNERRTEWLTAIAFYVALPALVFGATYDQDLGDLLSPALVVGVVVIILGTAAIAWVVHRRHGGRDRWSVAVVQSYHSNLGFLGVPLVELTLGGAATAAASVVLGVSLLVHVPLTIVVLATVNDAEASIRGEMSGLAKNPVLVSLALGLLSAAAGLSLPAAVGTGLAQIGDLALPLALLGVGASLQVDLDELDARATGRVVAMKVAVMPAVAWTVFSVLSVSKAAFAAVVLLFGMPSAVSTYVYASELGGDERFASVNVFVTTLASLATVVLILQVVG
jgi:predicted permease